MIWTGRIIRERLLAAENVNDPLARLQAVEAPHREQAEKFGIIKLLRGTMPSPLMGEGGGDTRTCASTYQVLGHRSRARVGGAEAAAVVEARRQVRLHRQDAALAVGDVLGHHAADTGSELEAAAGQAADRDEPILAREAADEGVAVGRDIVTTRPMAGDACAVETLEAVGEIPQKMPGSVPRERFIDMIGIRYVFASVTVAE